MPFHNSRLIASALFAGLIAMPGAALAQTEEAETPPAAEDQMEQQTQETQGQAETPGQAETTDQAETPGQADTPGQAEAMTPTDEQLESFAAATIDIVQIQETAQEQMQAAVEEAGLTIEEYNAIARAAQTDPEVDQALKELIQNRLGG